MRREPRSKRGVRLIALLTRLLPPEFRSAYAARIVEVFSARQATLRGAVAVRSLLHEAGSLVWLSAREWSALATQNARQFLLSDWGRELRLAARSLRRSPMYTASVIGTLGIGVAGLTALFGVVRATLLTPLPFTQPETLVRLLETPRNAYTGTTTSLPNVIEWRARARTLQHITAVSAGVTVNVRVAETVVTAAAARVSAEGFPMLAVPPLLGSLPAAEDYVQGAPAKAVVTYRFWRDVLSSDTSVVGGILRINGGDVVLAGVMPPAFAFPDARTDVILPLRITPGVGLAGPNGRWARLFEAYARVRPGSSMAAASAELRQISAQLETEFGPPNRGMSAYPVSLKQSMLGDARTLMLILLVAAVLVLLVACSNVAALTLARRNARGREIAIRYAHGASSAAVARTIIGEIVLLMLGAAVLAAYGAVLLRPATARLIPGSLPAEPVTLLQYAFMAACAALVTGSVLFIALLRTGVLAPGIQVLVGSGARATMGRAQQLTRSTLVVAQIGAACALLLSGGALLRSYLRVMRVPTGFDAENVLALDLSARGPHYANPATLVRFYEELGERVRALPGVVALSVMDAPPLTGGGTGWTFVPEGVPTEAGHEPPATVYTAGAELPAVLRVPLLAGRRLVASDTFALAENVLVTETLARRVFGSTNAIGRRIALGSTGSTNPPFTIVGVLADLRDRDLITPPAALIVRRNSAATVTSSMTMLVRSQVDPLALAAQVTRVMHELDPDLPAPEARLMSDIVRAAAVRQRIAAALTAGFGALAVLLACVGIVGLFAQTVNEQRQGLAIRMALGATQGSIMRSTLRSAMTLTSLGIAGGGLLSLAAAGITRHYLFEVSPLDAPSAALAIVLLSASGTVAALVPAYRITAHNILSALRT